ncbi:MAG: hypothetical protein FJW79_09385 [Actinobacteria bacterium]|nr:hypothetical protein [Actinomycetota bacterium]
MPHIQVRHVSDEVHEALVRRAAAAGQSLQQYLAAQLSLIATTPTLDEVLDRIESRRGGRLDPQQAVAHLEAERAGR